ncbi:S-adenosyl methyltransferase [Streptomyces sp. 3211.6]|uniref:Scr1 family TA system antitoxin-like transcriptional regulator n=1 Tax=Streptomyces sp. 3211.6 TaxID=1938845 RepID=UPI000EB066B9|nr:Scr1 family TA system antitoxin-like transcriptional regulator [Streptomyces sp. 3211.6]RKT08216.1 S-adenosyl methyltransferase [Streptomyces sp. 3211.6]
MADLPTGDSSPQRVTTVPGPLRRPAPARVYDFLAGGRNSYPHDQQVARSLLERALWLRNAAETNTSHLESACLVLGGELGIGQFIDLGCGYPAERRIKGAGAATAYNIVRSVREDVRVVYADSDPIVFGYAKALLAEPEGTLAVRADARDIPALLDGVVDLLDLSRPIAVLLHEVLPWIDDDEAAAVMRSLHDLLPAGSAVSVTHATPDEAPESMTAVIDLYKEAGIAFRPRTLDHFRELLGPWSLLPPGVRPTGLWGAEYTQRPRSRPTVVPTEQGSGSHAYAAVTAAKTKPSPPVTVGVLLGQEPDRSPGRLLAGAYLRALREAGGISRGDLARDLVTTPLAVECWEAGSTRLATSTRLRRLLDQLGLHERTHQAAVEHLLHDSEGIQEIFSDTLPGNFDRAWSAQHAATRIRAFALDRIPDPFQTLAYAALVPITDIADPVGSPSGPMPPVTVPRAEDSHGCTWDLILDEAALDRGRGNPQVVADQLGYLLHLDTLAHITVRVLALDSPFAMPVSDLTEYTLAPSSTLWRENAFTYTGLERGERRRLMLDRAMEHAKPPGESRAFLDAARARLLAGVKPRWAHGAS